jgi:hypothetical protein
LHGAAGDLLTPLIVLGEPVQLPEVLLRLAEPTVLEGLPGGPQVLLLDAGLEPALGLLVLRLDRRVEPAWLPPEGGDVRDQHLVAQPRQGHVQRLQVGQLPRPAGVRDRGLRRQPGQPQPVHDVRGAPQPDAGLHLERVGRRAVGAPEPEHDVAALEDQPAGAGDDGIGEALGRQVAVQRLLHGLLQFRVAPTDAADHVTPSRARNDRPAHRTARTARFPLQT